MEMRGNYITANKHSVDSDCFGGKEGIKKKNRKSADVAVFCIWKYRTVVLICRPIIITKNKERVELLLQDAST